MANNNIPQILTDISQHLSARPFKISAKNQDGRINSAINEDEVLNYLERTFSFEEYKPLLCRHPD